jgi:hypothetical protein
MGVFGCRHSYDTGWAASNQLCCRGRHPVGQERQECRLQEPGKNGA